MNSFVSAMATAWLLWLSPALNASIVPSVDHTFGTGSDSIFFVIDWNDGPDDNLNWRLDYTSGDYANVYDAMVDLENQDPNLSFTFNTDFGDPFLEGIAFDDGSSSHAVNTADASAPRDWISFWTGDAAGSSWTASSTGVAATSVTPGEAYGFNYEPDWNEPSSEPNAAIPEPAAVVLLLTGFGWLTWLRRTQR